MNAQHEEAIAPGFLFSHEKKLKRGLLSDCISIAAFDEGFIINKDGSIAVGFELSLFQEERLSPDSFMSIIAEFTASAQRLPIGTVIQKLDFYWEDNFQLDIPFDTPFFYKKTLEHHDQRKILKHKCVLFLRFASQEFSPTNTFLALGAKLFKNPFQDLGAKKKEASSAYQEFMASMPSGLALRKLSSNENQQLLYQYMSLTFHRTPIGFERSMVALPDSLSMGMYLKSVAMKVQAEEVAYSLRNHFGYQGVTSPFLWRLTHFARFPHILCQTIEIIDDKKFRKAKGLEMEYAAQLKFQKRARELAEHTEQRLVELEKELDEREARIVKLSLQVLTWHADKETLQRHTDQIKSAFGKIGIPSNEEAEDTDNTFFANIPGGTGFLEGCYMPLDTALAHFNFITPRKGDQEGLLLQDRHGNPIYYDPFKYSLDNQHAFIFGPSGSGKSFFNGKMIKDRYYQGHTVVVIDSGGTYRFLFQGLEGKYIEYNPESPLRLNPFLVKKKQGKYIPDSDKVAFLVNFLGKMWKGDLVKNPISEVEYALLSKFITFYYRALEGEVVPNLTHFCAWLKEHLKKEAIEKDHFDAINFFLVLEPFTEGIYKDHFNAFQVEYLQDQRLLCFELEAVKNDRKLYPLVVQVLFDYVLQLVSTHPKDKKFIDIEEGWTMLDDASESYIESFFRKGRKTNTSIRIITQNVSEIRDSRIAGAMRNNAATFILLYNDKASVREEIAGFLGMDDFDMEKYASLQRRDHYLDGYREVFIKEMGQSSVWRVSMSLFEHGILTSRPDERNAIRAFMEKEGNIEHALTLWVKGILEGEAQKYGH